MTLAKPRPLGLAELLAMSVAARTDHLEQLAQRGGLVTAPGPRTETEVLVGALAPTGDLRARLDPDTLPKTLWGYYFKAPYLLARLLQLFHPHLLAPRDAPLRVLFLGADREEVRDDGRWYRPVWDLLGLPPIELEITAVGPALANKADWESSAWAERVAEELPRVDGIPTTLMQAFTVGGRATIDWEQAFDLVVMLHPGFFALIRDWADDGAWNDLAGFADVPIVGASFDAVDFEFDKHGLAQFGRTVDQVYWNPTAHVAPNQFEQNPWRTRLQWGGVLWSTQRDPDIRHGGTSPRQAAAIRWYETHHPGSQATADIAPYLFWDFSCAMQFDDLHQSLLVTDDIRIDATTGAVWAFGERLPETYLTLALVREARLDVRLKLFVPVVQDIVARSTPRVLAAFRDAHASNRLPTVASLVDVLRGDDAGRFQRLMEQLAQFPENDVPGTLDQIIEQMMAEMRPGLVHDGVGCFRHQGFLFEPWQGADASYLVHHVNRRIPPPVMEGSSDRLTARVALSTAIASERVDEFHLEEDDITLVRLELYAEGAPIARLQAFVLSPETVDIVMGRAPGSSFAAWLDRLFLPTHRFRPEAEAAFEHEFDWTGEPEFYGEEALAHIELLWIAPTHRHVALLAYLLEHVRATATRLTNTATTDLCLSLSTLDGEDLRFMPMDPPTRAWMERALEAFGASRAPDVADAPVLYLLPTIEEFAATRNP